MDLRQSTAVVITFGPFLDKADGVTLETGLVSALDHASTGILLSKNGGTLTIRHATVTATTYDAHGCYKVTLDTTDTNTLGILRAIYTDAATCLPVWRDFMVMPATVWDALYASADLPVKLSTQGKADVNAEALDVLAVDTRAEPGQGTPPATTTLALKVDYIYKRTMNKMDNDNGTADRFYNAAGTVVDQKQTTGVSAGVVTKGPVVSGP